MFKRAYKYKSKTELIIEEERIKALKKYDILDTPPDGTFDRITQLAATLLKVPIAIVTLVDSDRIWFKSKYGIDLNQIDRDPGLCSSAILTSDVYIVEDALKDPRTLTNPLVAGEFGLQFYAAVPLKVRGGYKLGTLCVIDKNPRLASQSDKQILKNLADILIDQIELRLEARTAVSKQNQILNIAAHEMKNPLTVIPIWTDLIHNKKADEREIQKMCLKIKEASSKMINVLNELLESAQLESNEVELNFNKINLSNLINGIISTNRIVAEKNNQVIKFDIKTDLNVYADEKRLTTIIDRLINNAMTSSAKGATIRVAVKEKKNNLLIQVADEGYGFEEQDQEFLFERFSSLSNTAEAKRNADLQLHLIKTLVEAHHGKLIAESKGKNKGSKFTVELPAVE